MLDKKLAAWLSFQTSIFVLKVVVVVPTTTTNPAAMLLVIRLLTPFRLVRVVTVLLPKERAKVKVLLIQGMISEPSIHAPGNVLRLRRLNTNGILGKTQH